MPISIHALFININCNESIDRFLSVDIELQKQQQQIEYNITKKNNCEDN